MKIVMTLILAASALFSFKFNGETKPRYVDLNTGMPFTLVLDKATGLMVDEETGKPLNIYVDTKLNDTIYGRTGKVINGSVVKVGKNEYAFAETINNTNHVAMVPASEMVK